jgi:hypothetical protein
VFSVLPCLVVELGNLDMTFIFARRPIGLRILGATTHLLVMVPRGCSIGGRGRDVAAEAHLFWDACAFAVDRDLPNVVIKLAACLAPGISGDHSP